MSLIRLENIIKRFGKNTVLDGVSFEINKGDVIVLIGPSGTGKSTLLRCVNMLAPPDEGKIFVNDKEITHHKANITEVRQQIGMVFQHFALFNHLTALDNVMLGLLKVKKLSKEQAKVKAMFELDRVGMGEHIDKYPAQLSGGQKQRVGIARSLAMDPLLILFDEPTSALDPELIGEVLQVMQKLAKDGMTMICVTHEMGFAKAVATEVVFMDKGKIVEKSPPLELFNNPKSQRCRDFLNKIAVLHGE